MPQLRSLCELLQKTLPSLCGVILHGSAATSGFEPDRSDLDVLTSTTSDPATAELAALGTGLVEITLAAGVQPCAGASVEALVTLLPSPPALRRQHG